jgi:hypothetical protein
MPAPHLQNEDWFLTDEQSGMPGGRGAGGGGGSVTHGHTTFCPKPPPHLTSGWPSHSKRPRQPPPAHMEWLSKQPNRAPGMQGVLDWPVVSLMVQLAAALCRASSTRAATRKPAEPLLPLGPTMLLAGCTIWTHGLDWADAQAWDDVCTATPAHEPAAAVYVRMYRGAAPKPQAGRGRER